MKCICHKMVMFHHRGGRAESISPTLWEMKLSLRERNGTLHSVLWWSKCRSEPWFLEKKRWRTRIKQRRWVAGRGRLVSQLPAVSAFVLRMLAVRILIIWFFFCVGRSYANGIRDRLVRSEHARINCWYIPMTCTIYDILQEDFPEWQRREICHDTVQRFSNLHAIDFHL